MLVRLLYASRARTALDSAVIDSILEQCRRNNPAQGITGLLCYSDSLFMQVIEGGRDQISELYARICVDKRHTNVRLLVFEEMVERRFGSWTMGQVRLSQVNAAILLKYAATPTLDPFSCPGASSMKLLEELIATGSVMCRET